MGSMIMNTQKPLARMSVSTTSNASVVPSSTESIVARPAVTRLLPVARQVDALRSMDHMAPPSPPGRSVMAMTSSRAGGSKASASTRHNNTGVRIDAGFVPNGRKKEVDVAIMKFRYAALLPRPPDCESCYVQKYRESSPPVGRVDPEGFAGSAR